MRPEPEPTAELNRMLARAAERAARQGAPLLATALRQYAARERLDWPGLAARLHCDTAALDAIALCRMPREECFVEDVKSIAEGYTDWKVLLPLLRELQVLEGFSEHDPADAMLLAARDYEDEEDDESASEGKNEFDNGESAADNEENSPLPLP